MIDRILEIIKQKKLTPSQFAEEIGIQRSSVSHLVSGRNKPSLEFIQKILTQYPDISSDWLLSGTGRMMKTNGSVESENDSVSGTPAKRERTTTLDEFNVLFGPETESVLKTDSRPFRKKNNSAEKKQVEKIVYFYKDQTFKEFYPEDL